MKIKFVNDVSGYTEGQVIDLDDEVAKGFVESGDAVEVQSAKQLAKEIKEAAHDKKEKAK